MTKQIKHIITYLALLFCIVPAFAQVKQPLSPELKSFNKELNKAGITFTFPAGFKEIKPVSTDDYSFDYAIIAPEEDCEIWFQVKSQKENWAGYLKAKNDKHITNPDSLYLENGLAQANAFKSEHPPLARSIPQAILSRYNADLGKTFLVSLPDAQVTRHYKYAMVVVLQKNHTGSVLAVCFANELGPGFFRNLNKASSCLKFNPS